MNKSTILSIIGAIGVVGTAVSAVKATPKALTRLEEAKEDNIDELTTLETIKAVGPVYIPTILIGLSTIACILGANALNKHQQAMMASSYALLNNSYNKYRDKVKDIYGEDADKKVVKELATNTQKNCNDISIDSDEKQLFFDFNSLRYFESTIDEVLQKIETEDGLECYIISTPFF